MARVFEEVTAFLHNSDGMLRLKVSHWFEFNDHPPPVSSELGGMVSLLVGLV